MLRGDDDDDDIPPPVPAYNPDGVQEYSVLKREGEVRHLLTLHVAITLSFIRRRTSNHYHKELPHYTQH